MYRYICRYSQIGMNTTRLCGCKGKFVHFWKKILFIEDFFAPMQLFYFNDSLFLSISALVNKSQWWSAAVRDKMLLESNFSPKKNFKDCIL